MESVGEAGLLSILWSLTAIVWFLAAYRIVHQYITELTINIEYIICYRVAIAMFLFGTTTGVTIWILS